MSQEKYTGYYVELLTSTLQDQVLQNISLKAKEKVNSEIFEEVSKGYQTALEENAVLKSEKETSLSQKETAKNTEIESLKRQLSDIRTGRISESETLNKKIVELQNTITNLQGEINKSNLVRSEYEKVKQQLVHMDTFRNQLIEIQKVVTEKDGIIESLNQQILTLQSTPTKRKKASSSKLETVTTEENLVTEESTRDGGIF